MVLDVSEFAEYHPGGRFVLQMLKGRDISKFFYGGYCLENNDKGSLADGHLHSNYAKAICDTLCIATYTGEPSILITKVNTSKTHMWNRTTGTLVLSPVRTIRSRASPTSEFGQHYKVRSLRNRLVYRHYTDCGDTMRPEVYQSLIDCMNSDDLGQLVSSKEEGLSLTVKNYDKFQGVSFRFYEQAIMQSNLEIEGPLGRGLQPDLNGTNIAFSGGTGCLTFIQLVAAISKSVLGAQDGPEFGPNFKLILYLSFQSRAESICIELCEKLQQICEKKANLKFEVKIRLSKEGVNAERWSQSWIKDTLDRYKDKKKVWVCGPPPMSETFEKYVFNQKLDGQMNYSFEIL